MKKKILYLGTFFAAMQIGCKSELPVYDTVQDRLIFLHGLENGRTMIPEAASTYSYNYTFVYNEKNTDTLFVKVKTIGFVHSNDRAFELEQVLIDGENAVAGQHYLPLNDPYYKQNYLIQAGNTTAEVPIVVFRDPTLKDKTVNLRLRVKDNGIFIPGYEKRAEILVTITDQLARPNNWNRAFENYFGKYGKVKHQFMIDATDGEVINEEWLSNMGFENTSSFFNEKYDSDYVVYMADWFAKKLAEENHRRAALTPALPPLAEADNTKVSFP